MRRYRRSYPLLRRIWLWLVYGSQEMHVSQAWLDNEARLDEYAAWTERQREGAVILDSEQSALTRRVLFADRERRVAEMHARESQQIGRPVVAFRARMR